MLQDFHEKFIDNDVRPPSPRSTGVVFAVVFTIVALVIWPSLAWVAVFSTVAAIFLLLAFAAPNLLQPLNALWFRFGLFLHSIVNPVVMFAMFALVFVPVGLIIRPFYDPLRRNRSSGKTYWVKREDGGSDSASMTNQF